jgi:hypothetical protein
MKEFKEPFLIILVLFVLIGLSYGHVKNPATNTNTTNTPGNTTSSVNTSGNSPTGQSPFYNKIRMSNIFKSYDNDPGREYITLSINLDKGEKVNITGWYLKSDVTNYFVSIGKAALLPIPFTQTLSDVILKKGDRVYLTKGFSPIGISFRTNKCTGYFEENRTFTPDLPMECPMPIDEKLPTFSDDYDSNDKCLDTIERIPRCTTVGSSFTRNLPDIVTSSCKTYMTEQINYNTCVNLHAGDADFYGNEYRIYLNKFGPLWRTRSDKISLYDSNNLVVDTINY